MEIMKGIIGIVSLNDGVEHSEQLPSVRIYVTQGGEYLFLETAVLEEAIALSLKNAEAQERSVVLVAAEVLPISQRSQRRGGTT